MTDITVADYGPAQHVAPPPVVTDRWEVTTRAMEGWRDLFAATARGVPVHGRAVHSYLIGYAPRAEVEGLVAVWLAGPGQTLPSDDPRQPLEGEAGFCWPDPDQML